MLGCARELERQKVKLQVEVQQPLNMLAMQLRLRGCGDDEHDSTQPDEWCDMGGTQQEDCGVSFEPDPPQLLQVEDGEVRPWLSTLLPVDDRGVLNIGRTVTGLRLHDDARTAGSYLAHGAHATITNEQGCFVLRLAPARAGSGGMMTYINEAGYRVLNFNHFTYDPGPIPLAHGDRRPATAQACVGHYLGCCGAGRGCESSRSSSSSWAATPRRTAFATCQSERRLQG